MRCSFSTFFPTHPMADANPTNTAASVTVFTILLCSAIFRENEKTLSLPKCDLDVNLLPFWRHKWARKGVIYVFTMFKAKWAYYVFPPCTKCLWFKLALYKVFPVLFHIRYQHYLVGWQVSLFFWYFFAFFIVRPNVKSTYLPTISTYFNLSKRSNI